MATISLHTLSGYPTAIDTYPTIQDAISDLMDGTVEDWNSVALTDSYIIEVDADSPEEVEGFEIKNGTWSADNSLTIRSKSDSAEITLIGGGSGNRIALMEATSRVSGNITVEGFNIKHDTEVNTGFSGYEADYYGYIKIAGSSSYAMKDVTIKDCQTVNNTVTNSIRVDYVENLVFEGGYFENTKDVVRQYSSNTSIVFRNTELINNGDNDPGRVILMGAGVGSITLEYCTISGQGGLYVMDSELVSVVGCVFKELSSCSPIYINDSTTDQSKLLDFTLKNSVFYNCDNSIVIELVCPNKVKVLQNTICIGKAGGTDTPTYGISCYNMTSSDLVVKGNIFSNRFAGSSPVAIRYYTNLTGGTYDVGLRFSNINFNLYDSTGETLEWIAYKNVVTGYEVDDLITTLTEAQNLGYENFGVFDDPGFTDPTLTSATWYTLLEGSSARDVVLEESLTTYDIQGYYRQVTYQDAGAWDYQSTAGSVPDSDPPLSAAIYRLSDNEEYGSIGAAYSDNAIQTKDETIVINTTDDLTGSWFITSRKSRGFVLTFKASDSVIAANGHATVTENSGVCLALEAIDNLVFENIHFKGTGTSFAGVRLGLASLRNIIFKNCKFSLHQHGIYQYTGNSIEFHDCEFTDNTKYPAYINGGDNLVMKGCIFNYGSVTPIISDESRYGMWLRNVPHYKLIGCDFTDTKQYHNIKLGEIKKADVVGCKFIGAKNYALYAVGTSGYSAEDLLIENCIIAEASAQSSLGYVIQIDKAKKVRIIGNTIIHTCSSETSTRAIVFRDETENVEVYNNYFELDRTAGTGTYFIIVAQLSTGGVTGVNYKSDNNFYNVKAASLISLLSLGYTAGITSTYADLSELNLDSLELSGKFVSTDPVVSRVNAQYEPVVIVGEDDLIDSADDSLMVSPYDILGNSRGVSPDIGALELGASAPTIVAPVIDFLLVNRAVQPYLTYLYSDSPAYPIEIPAKDSLALESSIGNLPTTIRWYLDQVVNNGNPVNIAKVEDASGGSVSQIRLSGDWTGLLFGSWEFVITGSTGNDGTYGFLTEGNINAWYEGGGIDETVIVLDTLLTPSTSDGQVQWVNRVAGGIGESFLTKFPVAAVGYNYKLTITAENSAGSDSLTQSPVAAIIQARPLAKFKLSETILFAGDDVTIESSSEEADTLSWLITLEDLTEITGSGTGITLNSIPEGKHTINLQVVNGEGFTSEITKSPGLFVNPIPTRPYIDFNLTKEVVYSDQTVYLNGSIAGYTGAKHSRFLAGDEDVKWSIMDPITGAVLFTKSSINSSFIWENESAIKHGSFDILLHISGSWGGVKKVMKRGLTVLPKLAGATTHNITCSLSDVYNDPHSSSPTTNYEGSRIDGVDFNDNHALNTGTIGPGDVIVLSGTTKHLHLANLVGTEQNPIVIVPDVSGGPFEVIVESWTGIYTADCEHVIISGIPYDGSYDYGIKVHNNPDPSIDIPQNTGVKIEHFSKEIRLCGLEIYDTKFAGTQAKTEPNRDDPTTWRNSPNDFRLTGMKVNHNHIHDTEGEGMYYGYFKETVVGQGSAESGREGEDYYAHAMGETLIYRNRFINNGFDAIQVGCHYIGVSEIHDNHIENPGWEGVFGQDSSLSINWFVGKIYNNRLEKIINIKHGVDGEQAIFNNMIFVGDEDRDLDVIYGHCEQVNKWDFSTNEAVIVDTNFDYSTNLYRIFNNVMVSNRNAVVLNIKNDSDYMPVTDNLNNVVIFTESAWNESKFGIAVVERQRNLIEIMNSAAVTAYSGLHTNNYIDRFSNIGLVEFLDIDNKLPYVSKDSPLLEAGVNLAANPNYDSYLLSDIQGFFLPNNAYDYPIGAYTFMPINASLITLILSLIGDTQISAIKKGSQDILKIYKGSTEL